MQDILRTQAEIIDRGKLIELPLNTVVRVLDIPVIFSAEPHRLTFHELDLGAGDLWVLAPDAVVAEEYDYLKALVVKSQGQPVIALCTGIDESTPKDYPVASIFNLTGPDSNPTVFVRGEPRRLENNHTPAGGLGLSRLLRSNHRDEVVRMFSNQRSFSIDVRR